MNHQYIGARYVPKFSDINEGVWDNTYSYEALTIVKHGNDFYTSKKPVPVGISVTNTDYWVLTGNYNGAIISMDERINKLESWSNKSVLFVGDSYEGYYTGVSIANNIANILGITDYQRVYGGGYGFSAMIDHPGNTWKSLLESTSVTIDPDTVIIYGGLNDEGATDLSDKITEFNTYLHTRFSGIKNIYLAFIGFSFKNDVNSRSNVREACNTYRNMSNKLGWHFLEGVEYISRDFKNFDGTIDTTTYRHPSASGILKISDGMVGGLLDGYYNYENSYELTISPDSNITVGTPPITLVASIKNGTISLDMVSANAITYAVAPVNNVGFDFGTLSVPLAIDSDRKNSRYWIATDTNTQYLGRVGINYSRTVRMVYEGLNVPSTSSLRLRDIHEQFNL